MINHTETTHNSTVSGVGYVEGMHKETYRCVATCHYVVVSTHLRFAAAVYSGENNLVIKDINMLSVCFLLSSFGKSISSLVRSFLISFIVELISVNIFPVALAFFNCLVVSWTKLKRCFFVPLNFLENEYLTHHQYHFGGVSSLGYSRKFPGVLKNEHVKIWAIN